MSLPEQSRKRQYRQRIVCETCKKEIDLDYKNGHVEKVHKGVKLKFSKVVDTNQLQLSNFFVRNETPPKRKKADILMTSKGDPCLSMSKDSKYM